MGVYRRCNRDPSLLEEAAFRRTLWHRVLAAQPNWCDGTSAYRGYGVDGHPSPWNVKVGRRFAHRAAEGLKLMGLPRRPIPQFRERAQKIKTRQTVTYAGDMMRTAN